jgi:hypothetical protein
MVYLSWFTSAMIVCSVPTARVRCTGPSTLLFSCEDGHYQRASHSSLAREGEW